MDKEEVAVFAGIPDDDDDGDSDWVAGVTLSEGARVRLVPADGEELIEDTRRWSAEKVAAEADVGGRAA